MGVASLLAVYNMHCRSKQSTVLVGRELGGQGVINDTVSCIQCTTLYMEKFKEPKIH